MNWTQVLAFLANFAPILEPVLMDIEENTLQPAIKAYLATQNPNSDLVQFLTAIDGALDAFAQMEIKKL